MDFTVGFTSQNTIWSSDTLMFNVVIITNVGNGYNSSTRVFTSPQKETYVFYVSAVEFDKLYVKIDIVLNNVSKVRVLGESSAYFQTGTDMVVKGRQRLCEIFFR